MKNKILKISGIELQPGERLTLALPTPEIYTCAPLHIPMHIIHGKKEGPRVLICATLYGDEVNGIDIVHRLLKMNILKKINGTLICIPVMNVYGLINHTRNLPDGRDLADNFPGSNKGSFASRLAHLFTSEVINLMTHCINIRCGERHIYKLPQMSYHPEDEVATHLAEIFGPPLICSSHEKTGFFYSESGKPKCPTLIYEAGEALRSDDYSAKIGVKGILRVLRELDMLQLKGESRKLPVIKSNQHTWVRAARSGLSHFAKKCGHFIKKGEKIGVIADPFGTSNQYDVIAPETGIISAMTTYPHVYEGQGIIQICIIENNEEFRPSIEIPPLEPTIVDN